MPKVSTLAVYARRNKQNSPRTARQLISGTVVREIAMSNKDEIEYYVVARMMELRPAELLLLLRLRLHSRCAAFSWLNICTVSPEKQLISPFLHTLKSRSNAEKVAVL